MWYRADVSISVSEGTTEEAAARLIAVALESRSVVFNVIVHEVEEETD